MSPIHNHTVTNSVTNENAHFYETPAGENFAFSTTKKAGEDAFVDIGLPNKSMHTMVNAPVRFTHRRSQPNMYHLREIPGVQRPSTTHQASLR